MRKLGVIFCSVLLAGALWGCSDDDSGDPVCGDGVMEGTEECDDGNAVDTDECANDCTLNGYCGDGFLDSGEECDDGNTVDDDTCTNSCTINPICGDNLINGDDLCDGTAVGAATCESLGFAGGGTLVCAVDCQSYDTTGCTEGPDNDSCATADQITMDSITSEVIETPGDRDFFEFTALAGDWLNISTDANPDDVTDMIDTVIRVYDANCVMIAENDDAYPRVSTDSQMIIRLPADGTYFVEVLEFSDWYPDWTDPLEGGPTFTYDLHVNILPTNDNIFLDPENGDDAASAATLTPNADNYWLVHGMFRDETDVDVFTINISGTPATGGGFYLDFQPAGVNGNGSTTDIGMVYVTDTTDSTVYAQVDPSNGFLDMTLISAPGDYLLWVEHPGGTAGTNDFYVLKAMEAGTNPPETDSAANDTAAGAEPLTMQDNDPYLSGFMLTWIDAGDTDHYSFTANAGETVTVTCGSASYGTGLEGLTVELLDGSETVLATVTELAGPDSALIQDQLVTTAGTHYVRLSATGQDPVIVGNYVQCGVHVDVTP